MLEKVKVEINQDDFREGLTAVISVKVLEPQFEGQTKTKLGNTEVIGAVDTSVRDALSTYLEEHPNQAKAIVEKVILAATARHAAQNARLKVQRKSPLSGSGLPGKLSDCSSKDPSECELFLVEGDSAGGSAKQGRDRTFQAILPLRGKILNVEKAMDHKIFESDAIVNIFRALGVTIGTEDDPKEANLYEAALSPHHHHDRCRCRRCAHRHAAHDILLPPHASGNRERLSLHSHSSIVSLH
jgi:DNA gyrase subunit B